MLTSKPIKGLAKRKAPGFDDLYMHAYVIINSSELGVGNIKITADHLEKWGVSNAKLFADALKSAPNVTPANHRGMFSVLDEMMGGADEIAPEEVLEPMSVLTNKESVLGAAAILYTKVKENTYMIPSSVHEVILIDGEYIENNDISLNAFIGEVNSTCLKPEDFLSNHAYRYNGKKWENVA